MDTTDTRPRLGVHKPTLARQREVNADLCSFLGRLGALAARDRTSVVIRAISPARTRRDCRIDPYWGAGAISRAATRRDCGYGHLWSTAAGPADPASGMVVFARGALHEIGGTSAAAPFWAGLTLVLGEYARRHGVASLPFLAPLLYRLAADPRTAGAFHRPVRGGNRRYSVAARWNYVTGLGSPDVAVLARDLVALTRER